MFRSTALAVAVFVAVIAGHTRSTADLLPVCSESGTVSTDTTWLATCVHVVFGIAIAEGATVTTEPGTIVKMTQGAAIEVNGSLVAQGNIAEPVHFTSFDDDTVGGDTNGDGTASPPGSAYWGFIRLDGGSLTLNHTHVRYAGQGNGFTRPAAIWTWGGAGAGSITLQGSVIENNGWANIEISGTSLVVTDTIVRNGGSTIGASGISFSGSSLSIAGSSLVGNSGLYAALEASTTTPPTLVGNSFIGNGGPAAQLSGAWSGTFDPQSNLATGNRINGIVIGLSVPVGQTFTLGGQNPEMPYVLAATIYGRVSVEAGAIVKMGITHGGVEVSGSGSSLNVNGTPERPVYFTSVRTTPLVVTRTKATVRWHQIGVTGPL